MALAPLAQLGPATAAKMERLGILTGADLKAKPLAFLQEHFGKAGAWYYRIARGIDDRPVQPDRPRKSVGAEDTFAVDIHDLQAARAEVTPLVDKVWRHCEAKNLLGRTVTLKIKFADFRQITRSRTVGTSLRAASDVESIACSLLEPLFPTEKGIRLIGVTISSFDEDREIGQDQLSLI
ncbi:hypothetical protein GCM10007920_32480 [Ciceribacter naphthalenivorans]|uniref:DNA-directed DNA polymerase n=3 Tax=Pseudomonadota TaxID=1224 RepID=A0A512HKL4_9HYPH|nr:hypothetical protein RNA01_28820 [Ciceribacter naphthalenivorans]GLR23457.1 hypothetical protein GCM10007920_32480 [Ciceribacter naphthalenivorans]GLT06313.1 hypothetical protein GCM10007926_32480 [Sphingomonas psychrolutea]